MRIGAYEVTRGLGKGGMGAVYAAMGRGGEVAIKLIPCASPDAVARFERESRLQRELGEVAGFVPVIETGQAREGPYIVMPLLPGGTLRDRLRRGPLGAEAACFLATQLGDALGRAHAKGIVHRDLKPENCLYDARERPFVADLGLAKHFASRGTSLSLSQPGSLRGTAGYMAPEQAEDAKSVGPTADVFSLGCILHECVTGEPAFLGENVLELLGKIENGQRTPFTGPPWLGAIVERALDPDPDARFQDGAAFADALRKGPVAARGPRLLVPALAALTLVLAAAVAAALRVREPPRVRSPEVAPTVSRATPVPPKDDLVERAIRLSEGRDGVVDHLQALRLFQEAANAGNVRAMGYVGCMYATGRGVEHDDAEAARWFRKAADKGDTESMVNLGALLQNGLGVPKDEPASARLFEKAARLGSDKGMNALGIALYNGKGVAKDGATAVHWFREAEKLGNADAMHSLGMMHRDGLFVPQDDAVAVSYFRKAAMHGLAAAMTNLGGMYSAGRGAERNDAEAAHWFRQAAQLGDVNGAHNLGVSLLDGKGVEKNEAEAFRYVKFAADAGSPEAKVTLAVMYDEGRGVARDHAAALQLLGEAAALGEPRAKEQLEKLGVK